ncbi:MAG: neutral zinc metallopeptidase [Pseudomonadota bacterium]
MRWKGRRQSDNIDDRRGESASYGSMAAAPVVLRLLPALMRSRLGRTVLIGAVLLIVGGRMLGVDVLSLLAGGPASAPAGGIAQFSAEQQEMAEFVAVVLADTEDTWHGIFREQGAIYREPTLTLFTDRVSSACGTASSAVGPFYCPADQRVYIDLSFFNDLQDRFGAPGDFAQAYVIAHEVGHHVQTLLGVSRRVQEMGRGRSQAEVNALSVRQELQADCFAGVWGHVANQQQQFLEVGDLEEALAAATAIGDDRLQREAGHEVVPDSFTHGTSAQRVRWFRKGFDSGDIAECDTFSIANLD